MNEAFRQFEAFEEALLDEAVTEVQVEMAAAFEGTENDASAAARDARIDWTLERLGRIAGQQRRNKETAERRIAMITAWLEDANGRLARQAYWLEMQVQALTTDYDFGKAKSRTLPSGSFGTRKKPATVEIRDMTRALEWAKANGIETKVVETLNKTPVKAFVEAQIKATGELPDVEETGVEYVDESETFFVKATEVEA